MTQIRDFSIDHPRSLEKVETIRKIIERMFSMKCSEGETKGYGMIDYTLEDDMTIEWKSLIYKNYLSFNNMGSVLFETYSNSNNKPNRGKNIFTCNTDLFIHSFWDPTDTKPLLALVFRTEETRERLLSIENRCYHGKTENIGYITEWILVPIDQLGSCLIWQWVNRE